ncbi:MAG: hypothetical protein AB7H90_06395 [Alphaproteobacteria bacterium]
MTGCDRQARRGSGQRGGQGLCGIALAFAALLPAACAGPMAPPRPPADPFIGAWTTAERHRIAFRDDTVVMNPPGAPPTPLAAAVCDGRFRFGYDRRSREALLALAPQQPDLYRRLATQLTGPDYRVAELTCGDGGTTYVLLGERDLLAIHRDRDIAAIERLSR